MEPAKHFFTKAMRARILARARAFTGDSKGGTAVEFAFVAAPFFLLIFAIIEIALVFFASAIIENAVAEAARDIRTGELQSAGQGENEFRALVCGQIQIVADCNRLQLDVRTFEDFASTDFETPLDDEGNLDDSGFGFDPGEAQDIVVVRAFYDWPLLGPGLINGLANMPGNRRLISAATAFRNEPYQDG